ncbi:hypothetical protein Misp01_12470 [Microtetraspora sp. NBRC 13810]|uniref:alkaline shock response membrane anchor protein AmaP n=1 Tax=Microtetraspora sp. NBRC 13810 TaxID=3030990 RepID=UPI0024A52B0D|nr:alkaline shock response membrane anchor protein AmaP [Microtetraspora sp. NBRC 13810]GLW06117.1 hypothetical protein Misp01_12470 [Microtetraspora sp. NBRC 13810]
MERTTARGNRWGLGLCGLVLLALGGLTLARGLGLFGFGQKWGFLVGHGTIRLFADNPWIWYVIAAVSVIVALLGLRWLLAQGRKDTRTGLRLEHGPAGTTEIESSGVTHAIEADVEHYPSVQAAHAAVTGTGLAPGMRLRLVTDEDTPVMALRDHLGNEAIPRMRDTLEVERLPTVVQLRMEPRGRRERSLQ